MSKKELKLQNKDLEISVVDILNALDPSKTGKFTPFLIKMLRNEMGKHKLRRLRSNQELDSANVIERQVISHIMDLLGPDNIRTVESFAKHLEENRILENKRDINQYQNWADLQKEVTLANLKQNQKKLEKEVLRVLETDEWLVIRPLTLESSLVYGSGTKWCTAMKNNPDYFYRYCQNGILTYVINKKDGDKYGIMYNINEKDFSIWNIVDRRIDSIESKIPSDIIKTIHKMSINEKPNFEYFSQEEVGRYKSLYELAVKEEEVRTELRWEGPANEDVGQLMDRISDEEYGYDEPAETHPVIDPWIPNDVMEVRGEFQRI